MKSLLAFIFCSTLIFAHSKPPTLELDLDSHYKVTGTLSGPLHDKQSFHLISAENKKNNTYSILPVIYTNSQLSRLEALSFPTSPQIVSHHINEDVLSLVVRVEAHLDDVGNHIRPHERFSVKSRSFFLVDINLISGSSFISDSISDKHFKTFIRKPNESVLLFCNKKALTAHRLHNVSNTQMIIFNVTTPIEDFLKSIKRLPLTSINVDEFVSNGTITRNRVYMYDDSLFFSHHDNHEKEVSITKFNLDDTLTTTPYSRVFPISNHFKKQNTFVTNQYLFQIEVIKKAGVLKIYNLNNRSFKNIDLTSLSHMKPSSGFESISSFLKSSSRNNYTPILMLNNTTTGGFVVRIDFVNTQTHGYNYDWWWFNHQMFMDNMFRNQQIQFQNIQTHFRSFGPHISFKNMPIIEKKDTFFEIALDSNLDIIPHDSVSTHYTNIHKKKYINSIHEDLDFSSSVFFSDKFLHLGYNKKTKVLQFITKKLDDSF